MRTIPASAITIINKKLGTEPINILEIKWHPDGNFLLYADKDVPELNIKGTILEISTLESIIKLDSQGQSQSISVKLSDTSGVLKNIFNTIDIHGGTCRLFQWFEGLPINDRFKLYEGQITSPIVWSEGDRTLSFEVITQLEDKEVGFSPEEGLFPFIPEDLIGQPWPLVFGNCQNVPATLLSQIPITQTLEALSVVDPTLKQRIDELELRIQDISELIFFFTLASGVAFFNANFESETEEERSRWLSLGASLEQQSAALTLQKAQMEVELSGLRETLTEQQALQNQQLDVLNSSGFPVGQVVVRVEDIILNGSFTDITFNIDGINLTNFSSIQGSLDGVTPFGFTFIREGARIIIDSTAPVIYVVNLIPSTVQFVQAFKQVTNGKLLSVVPQELYTVKTADLGGYIITYITFDKPLSSSDEAFEDEIFITLTSPIGPNTVDILEWLITTYTNLTFDTTTFTLVKSQIDNYPSHFALLERRNILDLLEDIAFQSRCAIWISGGVVFLKYLSEEEAEVDNINEADIDAGSLSIFTTVTEDLVTKLTGTWVNDYSKSEKNRIILRHNVKIYGTREREIDFFIYTIDELILKSATFWLIRFANVWKNIQFETYLHKLALETFDTVKFNFTNDFVASSDIKGMITSAVYKSDEKTISMSAWLPVKVGTMVRYDFAEPKDIDVTLFFPTTEEINDGLAGSDGPGADVEATLELSESFLSSIGFRSRSARQEDGERIQGQDHGDQIPSDLDDVKPVPNFASHTFAPGAEPSFQYVYGEFPLPGTPPLEERKEFSHLFPGKITGSSGTTSYTVDVYKRGLNNDPENEIVEQLQISEGEPVPTNTWIIVGFNVWQIGADGGPPTQEDIENGTISEQSEYIMQVPVWL